MEGYAYYNGRFGKCDDIKIPLTDRLIYFGDGVYDVVIGHSKRLFLLDDHIDRLYSGMSFLEITPPVSKEDLISLINVMVAESGYKSYLVYISVSRGADSRNHSYLGCTSTNLLITVKDFCLSQKGRLSLITTEDRRYDFCNIKTINLLPSVLASTYAEKKNCDEAVFTKNGIVTECAHSNIFIIKDNALITHPESSLILSGITRKFLIKIAAESGIEVRETGFTKAELFEADEVLITSTTKLVKEAGMIDGRTIGGKSTALCNILKSKINDLYQNI